MEMINQRKLSLISLCALLILSINGFSQVNLNGKYSKTLGNQEHYEIIKFNTNGEFEFRKGASLGGSFYGFGSYLINDDHIVLNYDKTIPRRESYNKKRTFVNDQNTVVLNIRVLTVDNKPVPHANISLADFSKGVVADEKGVAEFVIDKSRDDNVLIVSNVGFQEHKFIINRFYNYEIEVYLVNGNSGNPILNQTESLEIISMNESSFKVRNELGKIETWYKN